MMYSAEDKVRYLREYLITLHTDLAVLGREIERIEAEIERIEADELRRTFEKDHI